MKTPFFASLNPDYSGAIASTLCVLHCLGTPFIFVAQYSSNNSSCSQAPTWWLAIDYLFIVITFLAVWQSGKHSSKWFMKYILFGLWTILTFFTINENLDFLDIHILWKYTAALSIISAHLYNMKFCQCKNETCCLAT